MRTAIMILMLSLAVAVCQAQRTFVRAVDDFESGEIVGWQSSMSGEYYKGGTGQKGLSVVDDPDRGKVLQCRIRYVDARASEPSFITRALDPRPGKLDVVGVRFWAKLSEAAIDPAMGFKVRLRTGDASFTDYDVQGQLGRPFPVGEWVRVELDTKLGPSVRNIWNDVFGTVRQMTFRLDDIDNKNTEFDLLIDDIELIVKQPAQVGEYTPTVRERPEDGKTKILLLKHRAAGYYNVEEAIEAVAPEAEVDTFEFRGYHFEFFGFPESLAEVLAYDAIIMLDVDPFMMSWEQCCWISDAVASGTRMLVLGGPVTLTESKDFKAPLRAVLPVTFGDDAKTVGASAPPEIGEPHFLNQGFDPAGLGKVSSIHDVTPKDGAEVPWTVKGKPLVITKPVDKGRCTVVNTWARVDKSPTGGFFTSTLSDDLMRRLVRSVIDREDGPSVRQLQLPDLFVIGEDDVILRAAAKTDDTDLGLRLTDDAGTEIAGTRNDAGEWEFAIHLRAGLSTETLRQFRLETDEGPGGGPADFRDFQIAVQNPVKLAAVWTRNKYTFAPGSPVEFTVQAGRRDVADVSPGSSTQITYANGRLPVSISGFVDSWVYKPGTETIIHNLDGDADVKVTPRGGMPPAWTVTGHPRSSRAKENVRFGEDDRILHALRGINVHPGGQVSVTTEYEFQHDMKVSRLPLLVNLPVSVYAGMRYTVEQKEGVREGVFPVETQKGKLFDGHGLKLTIHTPEGPVEIARHSPDVRVWMRDLRQYNMDSYRLEIESPYENREAKSGEKYRIDLRVKGPVAGGTAGAPSATTPLTFSASILDPRTLYRWEVPCVATDPEVRFAGTLPNLAGGEYVLDVVAQADGKRVAACSRECFVVDPLDMTEFFPIMSIVGIEGNGHYLDDAGVMARVDDLIAHGFNTAAITGTSNFFSGYPSNSRRLKGVAESYAQQRGMATTYEYSNFTNLPRHGAPGVCVFDPAYPEGLKEKLAWQIDVGNRTPRLMSAKVIDEPMVGPASLANISEEGKAAFKERYGMDYAEKMETSDDPYTRWAFADFMGDYVGEGYRQSAAIMDELDASFDLLLTYMATGNGYQRPLSGQQDVFDWTRHVKWADFDVYPYFYPASQRIRMVQAEFAMSNLRDVSRALGVPWGFYMELDDRNWPFQKNPRQATAECGFTAMANGADYLNSFINTVAGTGTQSRPERWEDAGKALRLIRRMGPMLKHMPPMRATVAVLFPNAQQAIGNGYPTPQFTLQAIQGGYGECDICNEEVAIETGAIPYYALFLSKTEFLHEDLVPLLADWLKAGGVLVCDALPTKTHRGTAIDWGFDAVATPQADVGALKWSLAQVGEGKIAFVENDINQEFAELAESKTPAPAACRAYREALRDLLDGLGLVPNVRVSYSETEESVDVIEAGLRGNENGMLLTVVNHQPTAQTVRVELDTGGRGWIVDTATMQPVSYTNSRSGKAQLFLEVPGRWARTLACYTAAPERIALQVGTPDSEAGDTLGYRFSALDSDGNPVKGGVLLEAEVAGPKGEIISRFGGAFAPVDGVQEVNVPVPVNAAKGDYTITVRAPQANLETAAAFKVE